MTREQESYLRIERHSFKDDPQSSTRLFVSFRLLKTKLSGIVFEGSLFNIGKIYQQIEHNESYFPEPSRAGQFYMERKDEEVVFLQIPNGRFRVAGCPLHLKHKVRERRKEGPPNSHYGVEALTLTILMLR